MGLVFKCTNKICLMFLCNRICKDEVISDYQKEVKKIKEVKLFSSMKSGLHHQTESFLMVSNVVKKNKS